LPQLTHASKLPAGRTGMVTAMIEIDRNASVGTGGRGAPRATAEPLAVIAERAKRMIARAAGTSPSCVTIIIRV
jgi:hypothetical protein